ncbi:MAG: kelch repeat-containing protein [Bacteroidales bacterium]|nr:kelch repeat-containing protein [Bacteroidales bacterium]
MKRLLTLSAILSLGLMAGCNKEGEISVKDYPYVITHEVTDITGTSVMFNAEIIGTGKEEISEYGFLWDIKEPTLESSHRAVIKKTIDIGSYHAEIDSNLYKGTDQFVRAYIKAVDLLVYGNIIKFSCNGGKMAVISEIKPLKGYVDSQVAITGKYFGYHKDAVKVYFGDLEAVIDSITDGKILVRVPDFDEDSEVSITLSVYNKQVTAEGMFGAFTYWKRIADLPGEERYGASSFSINGFGYVGLGSKSGGIYFNDFWRYDPLHNSWKKIADFPGEARRYAIGFSYNEKGYIGFGYANWVHFYDLWEYDPALDLWNKVTENKSISTYEDAYFLIGSDLYIVLRGGVYKLDLDMMEFSNLGFFTGNYRFYTVGFSSGDKGYIFAGQEPGNKILKDLWEYDSNTNLWQKLDELPGSAYRDSPVGFALGERIFMGMGYYGEYNDLFEYDLENGKWMRLEDLPAKGRSHSTTILIDGKAFVGTGYWYTTEFSDFYEFNPNKQ